MQIWVDADACPGEIKELLYRVAERRKIKVTLVANQFLRTPPSPFIETVLVGSGMNIADRRNRNQRQGFLLMSPSWQTQRRVATRFAGPFPALPSGI